MKAILTALFLATAVQTVHAAEPVAPAAPTVVKLTTARGVAERQPVEPGDRFTAGDGEVFGHVVVANPGEKTKIRLVWKREGVSRWAIDLNVGQRSKGWKTWAHKRMARKDAGAWTLEAVTQDGTVLQSAAFTVEAGSPTAAR
jgi:hypothetical protein